ncbi:MAG: hypothetical protein SGI88_20695 [Candidatus Hydrogenedentes bacterium]|nr:hypothetical protein [Candidatus Hydrogenedentota bacterium]
MNATKFYRAPLAMICVIALIMPGCASTKNVMNKATFGLIGGSETSESDQTAQAESKADRKVREKEEKQQREAEKQAAKDQEKAREAAEKEETATASAEEKPGLMNRMTFGLVGGDKQPDESKQQEAEAKAAKKEQERQGKIAREQEKRDAKEAKQQSEQEEKLAKKEQEQQEKAEKETAEATSAETEQPKEKRTLMSRMTFGLVGDKGKKEGDVAETNAPEPSAETSEPAVTDAVPEPEGAMESPESAAAQEPAPEPGPSQTLDQRDTADETEAPKEKRTLMSRMTFGLIGGKDDAGDSADPSDLSDASEPSEATALPADQLAMAAPIDAQYDVQPASAMGPEENKLAKMPFNTAIDLSTKSATGKGQATASRETYSKNGYGITDLGDVRIAVRDMKFDSESRAGGVIISSDDRAAAGGKAGTGNDAFIYEYAKGVTAVQFGTVTFTISNSVISIGGKSVPIGQGKKLVVVDQQGNVLGAYSAG